MRTSTWSRIARMRSEGFGGLNSGTAPRPRTRDEHEPHTVAGCSFCATSLPNSGHSFSTTRIALATVSAACSAEGNRRRWQVNTFWCLRLCRNVFERKCFLAGGLVSRRSARFRFSPFALARRGGKELAGCSVVGGITGAEGKFEDDELPGISTTAAPLGCWEYHCFRSDFGSLLQ